MATLNSLMKHLRESGVAISGSSQKRKLKNIGYYHGYKGYRFVGNSQNRLPLDSFNQVAALNAFDADLKSLFYPRLMQLETALKNYTVEAILANSSSERLDDIWGQCVTGHRGLMGKKYKEAWELSLIHIYLRDAPPSPRRAALKQGLPVLLSEIEGLRRPCRQFNSRVKNAPR